MKKMLLFIILPFLLSSAMAYVDQGEAPTSDYCDNVQSIGLVSNYNRAALDADKVIAFTQLDYDCAKQILGLWSYDFYLVITNLDGTELARVGGTSYELYGIYGLFPGNPISNTITGFDTSLDPRLITTSKVLSPPSGGGGMTAMAIGTPPQPLANPDLATEYTTFKTEGYDQAKTFKRLMLLWDGAEYQTVLVTLGVWNCVEE